jgi:hypothetical protein
LGEKLEKPVESSFIVGGKIRKTSGKLIFQENLAVLVKKVQFSPSFKYQAKIRPYKIFSVPFCFAAEISAPWHCLRKVS